MDSSLEVVVTSVDNIVDLLISFNEEEVPDIIDNSIQILFGGMDTSIEMRPIQEQHQEEEDSLDVLLLSSDAEEEQEVNIDDLLLSSDAEDDQDEEDEEEEDEEEEDEEEEDEDDAEEDEDMNIHQENEELEQLFRHLWFLINQAYDNGNQNMMWEINEQLGELYRLMWFMINQPDINLYYNQYFY